MKYFVAHHIRRFVSSKNSTERRTRIKKVKKEKIDPSSHKIWGLYRTGHNAHYLGKPLRGLAASAIFHETSLSSTELPTEAVEQKFHQRIPS
jgi:hypothetical protein